MRQRRATRDVTETIELEIRDIGRGEPSPEGFEPVTLATGRGEVETRYFPVPDATAGVITVGGVGGGFDTPVRGRLYPDLCRRFQREGTAALRVRYREPTDLLESTLDVLAGVVFLQTEGIDRVALVGHSFGGAVVIQAGALAESVRTVVALATQSYGVDPAADLAPRCSLLLAHGEEDEVLPVRCSRYAYSIAREPKKLVIHPTSRHGMDEWADELPDLVHGWITDQLGRAA